jgi:hypothetical protein
MLRDFWENHHIPIFCVCDDKNSIPLIAKEKIFLKNKSDNFGTEGLDENQRAHTQNNETNVETQPEASILPTKPHAGNKTIVKTISELLTGLKQSCFLLFPVTIGLPQTRIVHVERKVVTHKGNKY